MVVPLGPGKFYGGSLPRPRFYSDTKFNPDRVDPPLPVMEPLLSWANEAHWSMGGLSFKRLRLQGRIEGNVNKLRRQIEKLQKNSPAKDSTVDRPGSTSKRAASVSPPPAPAAVKRRRYLALSDSDSDSDSEDNERSDGEFMPKKEKMAFRRGAVRKLGDDFERVARESSSAAKGKSNNGIGLNVMKIVNEINDGVAFEGEKTSKKALKNGSGVVQSGTRTSPRLAGGTRTSPRLANRRMN
ncbi:hypothetical protein SLEP1_g9691 [Rubroshorea leprosula]|uniref:Uncharacterized protein n=1 Tax=Rubroshorea leprosula TaxID=152421 RepID=A0AAV5I5Q3_9ROSI|nr:hypothetical protein SLEP1_g9691 [Rubroshorea leprosula]